MPGIDWQRFYRALDRCTVTLPTPEADDPAFLHTLSVLLIQVNNKRMALQRTARKLDRLLGSARNTCEVLSEQLRNARAEARMDQAMMDRCANEAERKATVDLMTRKLSARLAATTAYVEQLKHARTAVESAEQTLKGTKETLNSLKSIALAERDTEL